MPRVPLRPTAAGEFLSALPGAGTVFGTPRQDIGVGGNPVIRRQAVEDPHDRKVHHTPCEQQRCTIGRVNGRVDMDNPVGQEILQRQTPAPDAQAAPEGFGTQPPIQPSLTTPWASRTTSCSQPALAISSSWWISTRSRSWRRNVARSVGIRSLKATRRSSGSACILPTSAPAAPYWAEPSKSATQG